jgi:hypothetical protein
MIMSSPEEIVPELSLSRYDIIPYSSDSAMDMENKSG